MQRNAVLSGAEQLAYIRDRTTVPIAINAQRIPIGDAARRQTKTEGKRSKRRAASGEKDRSVSEWLFRQRLNGDLACSGTDEASMRYLFCVRDNLPEVIRRMRCTPNGD